MGQMYPSPSQALGDQGFTTEEAISGVKAVHITPSGRIRIAMAAVSGRMPAIGLVTTNVASGDPVAYDRMGRHQFSSGMANFSGFVGLPVFVGRSGEIAQISGWWSSGGFSSGDLGQRVGVITNSGGIAFVVTPVAFSGIAATVGGGPIF